MKNPPSTDAPQSGLSLAKTTRRVAVFARAAAAVLGLAGAAHFAAAQTYTITDVSAPGVSPSFATGVNASGQVSLYSLTGASASHAWRFTPANGWTDLGSFGGADARATGINDAGTVAGWSRDVAGLAHGFVFSTATGLLDLGGYGNGEGAFPQHINTAGQVAGFSPLAGNDRAFRFSPPNLTLDLGTLAGSTAPAEAAAYGLNDAGRAAGIASAPGGFNHAFRTDLAGANMTDLGTLGGDESWAFAINNVGDVVGSASSLSTDTHAFLFTESTGLTDLQTLGGYNSTAFALNNTGAIVGSAEILNRDLHAFVWTVAGGMRDLNDLIPVNAGWVLTEARAVNDSGVIVGNGLLNGQPRAFLLTPDAGADVTPPVAIAKVSPLTFAGIYPISVPVIFWDNGKVAAAGIGAGSVRVTGPNGFNQPATFASIAPATDAMKITANYSLAAPAAGWNGAANGVYAIAIEPGTVRDVAGNFMPAGVIGTFTVALETKPSFSVLPAVSPVMNVATNFTLTAQSSFPYAAADVFAVTIDWNGDGSDVQAVSGAAGTLIPHTFASTGVFTLKATLLDPHGVAGDLFVTNVFVGNPPFPQSWSVGPVLPGSHRLSVGLNVNGTLLDLGGLPLKSGRDIVQALAPGAGAFAEAVRLPAPTIGLGAGLDSLGRVIVFGGIEPNAAAANTNGYVYTTGGGGGAAIAPKTFAVHDFAFATDNLHRLYSIGGATGAGTTAGTASVERYDAATNSWTTLAPLPAARVSATAAYDAHGHIIVIGGLDPATGVPTASVFSYDIATNAWTQLGDTPGSAVAARTAALGADGLVYLIGGTNSAAVWVFDSVAGVWYAGPNLLTARGTPAVALGGDGFLYAMGGDNALNGNNGLATTEKIDTGTATAPRIISAPGGSVMVGNAFAYQAIATGNPRPAFSLAAAPTGMTINATTGLVAWTPAANQTGNNIVTVRATSTAGVAQQTFAINVIPIPTQTDFTPPTAPASLTLTFRTATTVTMTWPAATDDVGVTGYKIYGLFRGSRSGPRYGLMGTSTTRSFIAAGGALGYAVSAVDAAGNESVRSPLTSGGVLTLPVITHPNLAESATVIAGNSFLYTLSAAAAPPPVFTTLTGPAGMTFTRTGGPLAANDYAIVQWQPASPGTFTFTAAATNPNTTGGTATFTVTVLPNGTDTVPPTPVAQMTASAISFDGCTLSWTAAGDNIGVTNYQIVATHFGLPGQPNHVVALNVSGATLTTPLTGLLPGAGYTVSIRASDAAGNIGPVTQMFFTTLLHPFPPGAELPHLSAGATPGTLSLDWTNPTGQWRFTVETTDSLSNPNWVPVPPASQWPSTATHFTITRDPLLRQAFFRVTATP